MRLLVPRTTVCDVARIVCAMQGFETNVLRITSGKFDTFIDWLATQLTS